MFRRLIILISCLLPLASFAKLQLPSVLSDNMVLQRNSTVKLWGLTDPSAKVNIAAEWTAQPIEITAAKDGKWQVEIATGEAGGPYTVTISSNSESRTLRNVLLGEVWICAGQSNMSMPVRGFESQPISGSLDAILAASQYDDIRMFTADRVIAQQEQPDVKGSWAVAGINTVGSFSAVGYFYACRLRDALKVPVGMINLSWGGSSVQAWSSRELLELFPEAGLATADWQSRSPQRIPTALYNALFCPVAAYGVKGIVWYQGENNVREPELYARLFPAMVKLWREKIGRGDIPFYFVQIAPYEYDGAEKTAAARLREVQARCQYLIPNAAMAVTVDLGEKSHIHFSDKRSVGTRLACLALTNAYGFDRLPCYGPTLRRKETSGGSLLLTFDHAQSGLCLGTHPDAGFEVAGADGVFHPAQAEVNARDRKQLRVWSDAVPSPAEVRYCFRNYAIGTLFDSYGLPAAPFRTDTLNP